MKRIRIASSMAALGIAVLLPMAASAAALSTTPAKHTITAKHHATAKSASVSKKVDLNTASREELMTLPGVDGPTADKIIDGRPYKNLSQLRSKAVVTTAEYRKLRNKVTARQSTMHS